MANAVRWGILGASKFALQHMAPAIGLARDADLVALATRSAEKADPFEALKPGLTVHGDYEALLADPGIDAVYIPLPHTLHVPWALKALDAGKHVLVEKPVAMKADEIDPLIAKRDASGLQCAEAYMIVHHPQWQRAKALLEDGAIGTLLHVDGAFSYDNSADMGNIRNKADTGGGGIPDIGVYTYGSTRWITGQEPLEITHADIDFEGDVDVLARVAARFAGFSAQWLTSMRMHPRQEMVFHGSAGVMRLATPFNAGVFDIALIELSQGMTTTVERFPGVNQYVLQIEAFGAAMRGEAPFAWTLEDARGTQAMIDAIFAKSGRGS